MVLTLIMRPALRSADSGTEGQFSASPTRTSGQMFPANAQTQLAVTDRVTSRKERTDLLKSKQEVLRNLPLIFTSSVQSDSNITFYSNAGCTALI